MKEQPRATLRIFEIVILNTKSHKNFCTKNFTYTKKFYVFEIAAVNLSKICFLKNEKKTCKPNKRDLNRDWIMIQITQSGFNPLKTSIPHHIETSQLICKANQLSGFYMMRNTSR